MRSLPIPSCRPIRCGASRGCVCPTRTACRNPLRGGSRDFAGGDAGSGHDNTSKHAIRPGLRLGLLAGSAIFTLMLACLPHAEASGRPAGAIVYEFNVATRCSPSLRTMVLTGAALPGRTSLLTLIA